MTMTRHGSAGQQAASPPRRSCKVEAISMRGPEDEGDGSAGAVLLTTTRLNEERARLYFMPYVM
jgi:hypothetical protein